MDQDDNLKEVVNDHVLELLRNVIREAEPYSRTDVVARALLFFLGRVSNTWRSMRVLDKHFPDEEGPMVDAGALLRIVFDAYLQAAYVVHDKTKAVVRAHDYFDFACVERYKQSQKVLSCDNPFANALKSSPERPTGEQRLQQEYDRVRGKYAVSESRKKGSQKGTVRVRTNWYPGTLADIAQSMGRLEEYSLILSSFHGCVHSSALSVEKGPLVSREYILDWASTVAARVASLSVEHNRIRLDDFYARLLAALNKPYFGSAMTFTGHSS